QRAQKTLSWDGIAFQATILSPSLDHLTLGRAALYEAVLSSGGAFLLKTEHLKLNTSVNPAVDAIRRANRSHCLPRGLLTRAWLRFLTGARTGAESAQEDLDEAWDIAERGPMKLFMADIHLYRARLFFREKEYPWAKNPDGSPRG